MNKKLILLIIIAVLLSSCGARSLAYEDVVSNVSAPESGLAEPFVGGLEKSVEMIVEYPELEPISAESRLVIKNASLSIVVEDPELTLSAISKMASDLGGYVVSSNLYRIQLEGGLEVPQANITLRVPSDQLDQALDVIKSGAGQILNENVSGQDVTQEYTDLESRLRNLERAEEQLTEIMAQAWETEDVLSVYNRLVEVQGQIEMIKGQMKYYEQSSALSAISVDIQANEAVQPLMIGNWQPVGVAKRAIQALINTLKFFADALIWIGLFIIPVALVLYFPIRWIWKGSRRLITRRKEKNAQRKAENESQE
jgi:hypothetical protein